jgi:hypothetical protein
MTPNNIAGMAALNGLQMIALTDHNSCANCPPFLEACKKLGIIGIAGMELTTAEDIHLVCLFEELEDAMAFSNEVYGHIMPIDNRPEIFGNQIATDAEDEPIAEEPRLLISATDLWISDAIELARKYGAHVRPAHIDRESNGIVAILGDVPAEYGFNYVEFKEKECADKYYGTYPSIKDADMLVCSDAHHLWDISEAENFVEICDEPYSSKLVRKNFFEKLFGRDDQ